MDALSRAVADALHRVPSVSLREIARRAGVPHVTLSHIRSGKRPATVNVATAVADALDAMAKECKTGEESIRRSLTNQPRREK